jgi:DNA primase
MYPIRTTTGTLVGFGGRDLTGKSPAKYKNSPESELFQKRNILYGMNRAKRDISKQKKVIVCEGYMDTIALQSHGYPYTVGAMGTALTSQNLRYLSTLADTIYLSLDSDKAGVAAAMRTVDTIPDDYRSDVKVLVIPDVSCANEEEVRATSLAKADEYLFVEQVDLDGNTSRVPVEYPVMVPMAKDPDEFFNQVGHTKEEFDKIIAGAVDIYLFCAEMTMKPFIAQLDVELNKEAPDTVVVAQTKMEAKRALDDLIARIYRKTNVYQRQNIANYAIDGLRLLDDANALEGEWKKRAATTIVRNNKYGQGSGNGSASTQSKAAQLSAVSSKRTIDEDLLIATLYYHPECRHIIHENLDSLEHIFTSETRKQIFNKIDTAYSCGRTSLQAQQEDMTPDEIKELSRIVVGRDSQQDIADVVNEDTVRDICKRMQRHSIENAIEQESQSANPDVMKIIELKMQLSALDQKEKQ